MKKISKSFFRFFGKSIGHNGLKICTVCHIIFVYKCYFIKISVSWKKLKTKVVPWRRRTTLTVPWSGLRRMRADKNQIKNPHQFKLSVHKSSEQDLKTVSLIETTNCLPMELTNQQLIIPLVFLGGKFLLCGQLLQLDVLSHLVVEPLCPFEQGLRVVTERNSFRVINRFV